MPTDTPREHSHAEAVEEEPLSNFLFGMLGDTGKYCSEHMYDRESELRREGVHNFLAVPWTRTRTLALALSLTLSLTLSLSLTLTRQARRQEQPRRGRQE